MQIKGENEVKCEADDKYYFLKKENLVEKESNENHQLLCKISWGRIK